MNKKIEDIELLRGIAVLLVVIQHANINLITWSSPELARFYTYFGGGVGVDLFFAISGFVIARDLLPRFQGTTDRTEALKVALGFWVRRAWRLLPSAWLWLGIILLAVTFFNESGAFGSLRANIEATIAGLLQVANFRLAEAFGRFEYGASSVYWSLSLEEQFYLLFPLIVIAFRKHFVYVVAAVALYQLFSVRSGQNMFAMCMRTDALCLGILLAAWSRHPSYALFNPAFLRSGWAVTALIVTLLVCVLALGSNTLNIVSIRVSLVSIIMAVLVWIASYNENYVFGRFKLVRRLLLWVGARSYAIYLIHMPAFFLTREIWHRLYPEQPGFGEDFLVPFVVTAAGLIIVLSELNYRLVECPLRERGRRIAQKMFEKDRRSDAVGMPIQG
ncbi:acyltransferase family protein [Zestomonas thermotolerans]|uniref:acyltransferase family protein n=1 Tax=Zestomonas thermotolerans TaxID=157784 RepID=UPI00036D14DD|nr:acyltransferase [Pseudomonas thermotolerans]